MNLFALMVLFNLLCHDIEHCYCHELWFDYCNTCTLFFLSLKLETGLKRHSETSLKQNMDLPGKLWLFYFLQDVTMWFLLIADLNKSSVTTSLVIIMDK